MRNGFYELKELTITGLPVGRKQVPVTAGKMALDWNGPGPFGDRIQVINDVAYINKQQHWDALVAKTPTIYRQVFDNTEWPNTATHKLVYRVKSWPCGWEEYTRFFDSEEALRSFVADYKEWTRSEDNYFEVVQAEVWDWGPEALAM